MSGDESQPRPDLASQLDQLRKRYADWVAQSCEMDQAMLQRRRWNGPQWRGVTQPSPRHALGPEDADDLTQEHDTGRGGEGG